jgi:hypothetical protein
MSNPKHHTVACQYAKKFSDLPNGRSSKLVYFNRQTGKLYNKQNNGFISVEKMGHTRGFNTMKNQNDRPGIVSVDYTSLGDDPTEAIEKTIISPMETKFCEMRDIVIRNKRISASEVTGLARYFAALSGYQPHIRQDLTSLAQGFFIPDDFVTIAHLETVEKLAVFIADQKWSLLYIPEKRRKDWRVILPDVGSITPSEPVQYLPLDRDHIVMITDAIMPPYQPLYKWELATINRISINCSQKWYACGGHTVVK